MTLFDYFMLIKRRWKPIVLLVILTAALTLSFAVIKNKNIHKATIFLTIGVDENGIKTISKNSIYENVQAADQFTETVQGWFKNPNFLQRIEQKSSNMVNMSVHKQEKQNLVITYSNFTREQGQKISEVIKWELLGELNTYNQQTSTAFELAIFGLNIKEEPVNLSLFILLGLVAGFIIGLAISYSYECIFQIYKRNAIR